jgi:hypothetical protein
LQSTSKVKAGALWNKNKDDLLKQLNELKTELGQLRIQKIASSGSKLNKMYAHPCLTRFPECSDRLYLQSSFYARVHCLGVH